ncbi:hypothetical protein A2U01_0062803, partial [Trifolium medium]|nr:hypothetical protein [Trifolium medium]
MNLAEDFSVEDDVRAGSAPDDRCVLLLGRQGSVREIVVYGRHPTVTVADDVYVEDPVWLLDARAGENLLDYRFVSAFPFRARQLGQDIC